MIKYYKIPKWHIVYAKYNQYLENRKRTAELAFMFMRKHGLYSGLIKAGEDKKVKKVGDDWVETSLPYFMISDPDPLVLEHDRKILGTASLVPTRDKYYPIRRNSKFMEDWRAILKENDNFKVLSIPDLSEYIILTGKVYKNAHKMKEQSEKGKLALNRGCATTMFHKDGEDVYVKVEAPQTIETNGDFIECPEASKYFEEE